MSLLCKLGIHRGTLIHATRELRFMLCDRCMCRYARTLSPNFSRSAVERWEALGKLPILGGPPRPTPPGIGSAILPPSSFPVAGRDLDALQLEVKEWTDRTFPHSTQLSRVHRLLREVVELYAVIWETGRAIPENAEILAAEYERFRDELWAEMSGQLSKIFYGGTLKDGDFGGELGDCVLLLCDMAANAEGTSLYLETRLKLAKVKARRYGPPDASGVSEHVRE